MTPKKLFNAACAAVFAALCLAGPNVCAQSPPSPEEDGSANAVILSASGKERRLRGQADYIGRAGLRANQLVSVTLRFPVSRVAQPVLVFPLDGGRIVAAKKDLSVSAEGTTDFKFQAASEPGLYRILVQAGVDEYRLEFYVLNTEHPEKNPPRVRIVD